MPRSARTYIYASLTLLCGVIAYAGWRTALVPLSDPELQRLGGGELISVLMSGLAIIVTACFLIGLWLTWEVRREERYDRREREGRCCRCGYDLRASTGNKCSECGFPIVLRNATMHRE